MGFNDPALARAVALIARFEGFRAAPYQDGGGVWTIGFGTTRLPDGEAVSAATPAVGRQTAAAWLADAVSAVLARVRTLATVRLTDGEAVALTSFAYNVGVGALAESTLLRLLNAGDAPGAAAEFGRWVRDGRGRIEAGLVARRGAERAVFLA